MNRFILTLLALSFATGHAGAQVTTLLTETDSGWAYLHPTNGVDPATSDTDFNTTWLNQPLAPYPGAPYNGPAFTTGATAPFQYGTVTNITTGTTLAVPASGNRYTSYFVKVIDGGAHGYHSLEIDLLADDGAFVYLNGVLVARDNVSGSDIYTRLTDSTGSETAYDALTLVGAPTLSPGPNLLAVSNHNVSASTSSDLGFAIRMRGVDASLPITINLTRNPYLQSSSHDRITICWRTSTPGYSTVRYGATLGVLNQSATLAGSRSNHEITLTGLAAGTTYFYQVETGNGAGGLGTSTASADHFFTTSPPAGSPAPTRIWVIGDSGTADSNAANVYNAFRTFNGQDHTDVWLMLGDNAYESGTDPEFQAAVFDMYPELLRNTPLWPTFGNHDAIASGGAPYFAMFHFPTAGECGGIASGTENYYSFDHGNIHFICLDSQTAANYNDTLGGSGMADWLQSDLEATTADWIIAYYHHGPYTFGSHNSDTSGQHIAMRNNTLSILEDYGVDLILAGHSHCYERSRLINGHYGTSGTYVEATHAIDPGNGSEVGSITTAGNFILSGADGAYQKPLAAGNRGQVSSIVGSSGKVSNWKDGSNDLVNLSPHPVFVANLRLLGSMIVDIDGHTLHAVFLDDNGDIRDDFTILKGSTLTAAPTDPTMTEGAPGNTATITVSRTGATSLPLEIDYSLSGSATPPDYTPALIGTLSFAPGETSRPITLTAAADSHAEGLETLTLTLVPRSENITVTSANRDTYFLGSPADSLLTIDDLPSQNWWFTHLGAATLTPALWALDHERDGLDALSEYALNGDPHLADSSSIHPTTGATTTELQLHYIRDNSKSDLQYRVLTSTGLNVWTPAGVTDTIDGAPNPAGPEPHIGSVPLLDSPRFLILEITLP